MLRFISLVLFTISIFIDGVSAITCYDGRYYYYCSAGQSCGYSYDDCRGLPTYAIISIVSGCILLLSICIRCCIYMGNNNRQAVRRVPVVVRNPGVARPPARPYQANTAVTVPVHYVQEDAPPNYAAATAPQYPKY